MSQDPSSDSNTLLQPRFVLAAIVITLIAVFAVVLAVSPPGAGVAGGPSADRPPGAALEPAPQPAPTDSVCGLQAGDQTVPAGIAPATDWELVGTVAAPIAPDTIGPGTNQSGLRSCYARSPLGALYAAANFLAGTSDPNLRSRIVRDLTANGAGREAAIRAVNARPAGSAGTGLQIRGFSFFNYDANAATIDVAFELDGVRLHLVVSLRWESGDWKVLVPLNGDLYAGIQAIPDLTGYVLWSGA